MGIYINGLDFHSTDAGNDPVEADGRISARRSLAADFRFIEKRARAVPGLMTMSDSEAGARSIIRLAGQLDRRALAA